MPNVRVHAVSFSMIPLLRELFVRAFKSDLYLLQFYGGMKFLKSFQRERNPFAVTNLFLLIQKQRVPKIESDEFHAAK